MTDELRALSADLRAAGGKVRPFARKALEVTGRSIKDDWSENADRTGLSGYAASVDYELKSGLSEISVEVGPNLGKNQGSFGFVEDGGGGVQSAPQHAGRDALEANEDDFYDGLAKAAADAILGPL